MNEQFELDLGRSTKVPVPDKPILHDGDPDPEKAMEEEIALMGIQDLEEEKERLERMILANKSSSPDDVVELEAKLKKILARIANLTKT